MAPPTQTNTQLIAFGHVPVLLLQQQQDAAATAPACHQQRRQQQSSPWSFQLVSSTPVAAAPFARLTAHSHAGPQELFLLSRFSGSSSDLSSTGTAAGSGYESESDSDADTDTGYSSDLHLDRINCQICKRPLNERPGKKKKLLSLPWGGSSSGSSKGHSTDFLVCDCCQRCYHRHCCKQHGISTKEREGIWFHDSSCQDCQQRLQDKVAAGPVALPGGRSWQLIDCAPVDPQGPGGVKALQALKQHLSDVLEVMLPAFGPGAAQQLVDTNKGYAVLLKKGKEPLTAGLMDVYGKELAVLDLVATAVEHKGDGHCRALLQALEGWLGPELGVAKLVAVCPADEPRNLTLWQQKFGFKKLDARALKALQSSVPALNYYEESTLLSKTLKHAGGSSSKKQRRGGKEQVQVQAQEPAAQTGASLPVEPLREA